MATKLFGICLIRICECAGIPDLMTQRVAEDSVETWVECRSCGRIGPKVEDGLPDEQTAVTLWEKAQNLRSELRSIRDEFAAIKNPSPRVQNILARREMRVGRELLGYGLPIEYGD